MLSAEHPAFSSHSNAECFGATDNQASPRHSATFWPAWHVRHSSGRISRRLIVLRLLLHCHFGQDEDSTMAYNLPKPKPITKYPGEQRTPGPYATSTPDRPILGRVWWRACSRHPCPVCGRDSYCLVRPDEVLCTKYDSDHPVEAVSAHWHPLTEASEHEGLNRTRDMPDWTWSNGDEPHISKSTQAELDTRIAPAETLDQVYRALIYSLDLWDVHKAQLRKRGLSDAIIAKKGYKSLPRGPRFDIAEMVLKHTGRTSLEKIPGFYRGTSGDRKRWAIAGPAGLLIPLRNEDDKILFLQVRLETTKDGKKKKLYLALSSNPSKPEYADGGTSARTSAHVAIPQGVDRSTGRIWITEGPLKADVASELLRAPVVGVPGVGHWITAFRSAPKLLDSNARDVVVAYDADKMKKPEVQNNEINLIVKAQECGHKVWLAKWDVDAAGNPKGLDDLLANGGEPAIVSCDNAATITVRTGKVRKSGKVEMCAPPAWARQKTGGGIHPDRAAARVTGHIIYLLYQPTSRKGVLHLRHDPMGIGKTTAVVKALKMALTYGWPTVQSGGKVRPLRVLILVDSSREVEGLVEIKKGASLAAQIGDSTAFLSGRNSANCNRMDEVKAMGASGHDIKSAICLGCLKWHKTHHRINDPFPDFINTQGAWDDVCLYLRHLKNAQSRPIHIAHKNGFLNDSSRLDDYDMVIVDEDMSAALMRTIIIEQEAVRVWIFNMEKQLPSVTRKVEELTFSLTLPVGKKQRLAYATEQIRAMQLRASLKQHIALARLIDEVFMLKDTRPLVDVLHERAAGQGWHLTGLIHACATGDYCESKNKSYFEHEAPKQLVNEQIPQKAWRTLLDVLEAETSRPTGDHQAHVVKYPRSNYPATIQLRQVRDSLITLLRGRSVLNLDSTPNIEVLSHVFNVIACTTNVPDLAKVAQLTDFVFGKTAAIKQLPQRLVTLTSRAIKSNQAGEPLIHVGVLSHRQTLQKLGWINDKGARTTGCLKDLQHGNIPGSENVVVGYWGRDERATNIFKHCDVLIIGGLHLPPLDEVWRDVQAWRRHLNKPKPAASTVRVEPRSYGYVDLANQGRARGCAVHPDPDVDKRLQEIWAANVRQAVGRLRGTRSDYQKLVIIDCAMPLTGLELDWLGPLSTVNAQAPALKQQADVNKREKQDRLERLAALIRPAYQDFVRKSGGKAPTRGQIADMLLIMGSRPSEWEVRQLSDFLKNEMNISGEVEPI
jgi:hypothetical protein